VYAMGIDPNMRNTIWPNGGITHLLRYARPTVCVSPRIYPAFDLLCDKGAICARANFDVECGRVTIERKPLFVSIQHNFDRASSLARKAGNNSLVADKRFPSKSSPHRWADDTNLIL